MRPISLRRWAQGGFLALALIAFALPVSAQAASDGDGEELRPSARSLLANPFLNAYARLRVAASDDAAGAAASLPFQRHRKLGLIDGESLSDAAATWDVAPTWEPFDYSE
jgi:hypothetical protein